MNRTACVAGSGARWTLRAHSAWLALLVVGLATGTNLCAVTYYVDDGSNTNDVWTPAAIGNDANNGLSATTPKATIQSVIDSYILGPNDVIFVDAGTYDLTAAVTFTSTDDGDATGPVTVRGALNGTTRLTVINDANDSYPTELFFLNAANYIVLQDLELGPTGVGTAEYGIRILAGTDCQVVNCWIHDTGAEAILLTGNAAYAARTRIASCEVNSTTSTYGAIENVYHLGAVIEDCVVRNNPGSQAGIQVESSTTANPVTIRRCRIFSNAVGVLLIGDVDGVMIEDNAVYSCSSMGIYLRTGCDDNTVRRNRVYDNASLGVYVTSGGGSSSLRNALVNNTIYSNNNADAQVLADGGSTISLRNNIIWADIAGQACVWGYNGISNITSSNYNNLYISNGAVTGSLGNPTPTDYATIVDWRGQGFDSTSIQKNPRWVDADGADNVLGGANGTDDDFHLASTFGWFSNTGGPFFSIPPAYTVATDSPSIDAGDPADAVGSETADNGGRIDQGAYGGTAEAARSGDPNYGNTWTGWSILHGSPTSYTASDSWNNANNWSRKTVPDSTQNVLIPDRSGVDEDLATAGIQAPSPPRLDVTTTVNTVYVGDTANTYGGASPVAVLNFTNATDVTLTVAGTAAAPGAPAGATVYVSPTGEMRFSSSTLTLPNATATNSVENDGTVRVSAAGTGNATIDGHFRTDNTTAGQGLQYDGAFTLSFQRDFRRSALAVINMPAGSTLRFSGSSDQSFFPNGASLANMTVAKALGTLTVAENVSASGNLSVSGGTADFGFVGAAHSFGGTTSVSGGTLLLDAGSFTATAAMTVSGGTLRLSGGAALNLDGVNPALTISSGGRLESVGAGGTPSLRRTSGADTLTVFVDGALDVNGLELRDLGPLDGGREGFEIGPNANVINFNDLVVTSNVRGIFVNRASGGPYTLRGCQFLTNVPTSAYNIRVAAGTATVVVENATGVGGQNDSVALNGIGGEENDSDPGDSDPNSDSSQGRITWSYFGWKWVGGFSGNVWNDGLVGNDPNWEWNPALGPRPSEYPDATNADVWIQGANPCNQNGSFNVGSLSVSSGSTLNQSGTAVTLSIWGTAFKSAGGTFTSGPDEDWVEFRGGDTQTLLIIGGAGAFRNLRVNKSSGTTASLGTSLTVNNQLDVLSGNLDLADYTLTVNGTSSIASALRNAGTSKFVANGACTISGTYTMVGPASAELGNATHTITGTVELNDNAALRVANGGTVNFNTGSTLRSSGTGPSIGVIGSRTTGFAWNLNSGSTVNISRLNFSNANSAGFNIASGVTVAGLQNIAFTSAVAGGRHLSLNGAYTFTLSGCSFDNSFLPGGYNIWTGPSGSGTVTVSNFSGAGAGDANDFDSPESAPGTAVVTWAPTRTWNGRWRYRQNVRIVTGANALPQGYSVQLVMNTTGTNFTTTNGDDIRVFYAPTNTEIDRHIINPKTASTEIWFKVQNPGGIPASTTNLDYWIYYGASAADSAGPPADLNKVYLYGSSFEAGADGWTQSGTNSSWARGNPTSGPGSARTGSNVWATNLQANYNNNECSYLQSPSLDLSSAPGTKRIEFYMWREFEPLAQGKYFDGAVIDQFTGNAWTRVTPTPAYDGALAANAG